MGDDLWLCNEPLRRTQLPAFSQMEDECQWHSVAHRHSCLIPTKNEGIDIDSSAPVAEDMINQQTIFVYP